MKDYCECKDCKQPEYNTNSANKLVECNLGNVVVTMCKNCLNKIFSYINGGKI